MAADGARRDLLAQGLINDEEWETVLRGLGKLSEKAVKTSPWPKGFF